MSVVVVGLPEAELVSQIASAFHVSAIPLPVGRFADSECYVSCAPENQIKNNSVIYVSQYGWPLKDGLRDYSINDYLIGVVTSLHLLKQQGARSLVAVLPYLPYARQEKCFCDTLSGPLMMWGTLFGEIGVDWIVSCDVHSPESVACFNGRLYEINLTSFWVEQIKKILNDKQWAGHSVCFVSPDNGGFARVQSVANEFGYSTAVIKKERVGVDKAVALKLTGDVKGKIAIIIDDILDTAHTASNACQLLRDHGACSVIGCFSHAVLSSGACQRMGTAGFDCVVVTDTIARVVMTKCSDVVVVPVSNFVAQQIAVFCEHTIFKNLKG